jgi:hypothetical protein
LSLSLSAATATGDTDDFLDRASSSFALSFVFFFEDLIYSDGSLGALSGDLDFSEG